jgi:glycosyltransferase involved in cell wall biosynthesis
MSERKKLFIVTYNFGNVKAGPVIRFMRYAPIFAASGIDVTFITKIRDEVTLLPDGVNAVYIDCRNNSELNRKAVAHAQAQGAASLLFLALDYACYFSYLRAKRAGIKLIYVSTMNLNIQRRSVIKQTLLRFVLRNVYSIMDHIVCSSSELTESIKALGIPGSRFRIISNGVDTSRFKPLEKSGKEALQKSLGLDPERITLLYVGLFVDRKGILDLFNTWKEIMCNHPAHNLQLCLVGQFKESTENSAEFLNSWPGAYETFKTMNNVHFFPFSEQIEKFYQAADAFVFYSKLEGMPNVYLEALSSALSIFTTEFEGFSSLYGELDEDYIRLTRTSDIDASRIFIVSQDLQKFHRLQEKSRNTAKSVFSLNKSIQDYCDIL